MTGRVSPGGGLPQGWRGGRYSCKFGSVFRGNVVRLPAIYLYLRLVLEQ